MSHFDQIYSFTSINQTRSVYNDWAATYEKDLSTSSHQYIAPVLASARVLKCLGSTSVSDHVEILDAGCGTGLVGANLAELGAKKIDGIDLSPGMLEIAGQKNAYRSLKEVDMSHKLPQPDESYDVVVCVGTLTQAHVGPQVIDEFVRITKNGGFIVATVLASIWESGGYKAKVEHLASKAQVRIVNDELEDYRPGAGVKARMIELQVLA